VTEEPFEIDPAERASRVPGPALEAVHEVEVAAEWIERAFGALLDAHHRTGHAQEMLLGAAEALAGAGHDALARDARAVAALDAVHGRWTYQMVDEYRSHLLGPVRALDAAVRAEITGGVRHCHEARQKATTPGATATTGVRLPPEPAGGDA
jgi:hypothetical protein